MMEVRAIGLIGHGEAFAAIAARLSAQGMRVLALGMPGHSQSSPKSPRIEIAASPSDIALGCEIVISTIEDSKVLREAVLGTAERPGFAIGLAPGSILTDCALRTPGDILKLAGLLGRGAIAVIDAPILGNAAEIASGTATIFAGGYPDSLDRMLPILSRLGAVTRAGRLGNGHALATIARYVRAARHIAAAEALEIGARAGLSPEAMAAALEAGSGSSTGVICGPDNSRETLDSDIARIQALALELGLIPAETQALLTA